MAKTIHIHEDDWGLRNLFPIAGRSEAAADQSMAREASKRNRDPSGYGWNDLHVIKPPPITYADVNLSLSEMADALGAIMPRIRKFYATVSGAIGRKERDPWGSYEDDAWCFGHGEQCFIKLEPKGELVERIWFDLGGTNPKDHSALRAAFEAVDARTPSIIVDYPLDLAGPTDDPAFLDAYFAAHAEEVKAIAERIAKSWRELEVPRPPAVPYTVAPPPKASR